MKLEERVYQFENASIIYTAKLAEATGKVMPKLYIQAFDAYGYQRELSVEYRWRPGDSKTLYWEYHIYHHPGRRFIGEISPAVAKRFIARFLELCEQYPALLFNRTGDHATNPARPRNEGFVRLAELLHRGTTFSVKILDCV